MNASELGDIVLIREFLSVRLLHVCKIGLERNRFCHFYSTGIQSLGMGSECATVRQNHMVLQYKSYFRLIDVERGAMYCFIAGTHHNRFKFTHYQYLYGNGLHLEHDISSNDKLNPFVSVSTFSGFEDPSCEIKLQANNYTCRLFGLMVTVSNNQGPDFDEMSSFFPCEINDAIQYINLGYETQA